MLCHVLVLYLSTELGSDITGRQDDITSSLFGTTRTTVALSIAFTHLWMPKGYAWGAELEALAILVESYERKRYPPCPLTPLEAVIFRVNQTAIDGELGGR